jgi:hypothetical protein
MAIADVLAAVAALIVVGIGFPALLMLMSLCFPVAVERASLHVGVRPVRALAQGVAAFVALTVAAGVLKNLGPLGPLAAFLTFLCGLSLAMLGAAGVARHLAGAYRRQETAHPRDVFLGGVLIEMTSAVPLVGWFVVLPVSLLMMLGAGCAVVLRRRARRPQQTIGVESHAEV